MISFRLDGRSGVPAYQQIVQQVRQAVALGFLKPGDQLPLIREVSVGLAINPNTVAKAYRELELAGLVDGRPGIGTFVADITVSTVNPSVYGSLKRSLAVWVQRARSAGLDDVGIDGLIADVRSSTSAKGVA